MFFFCDIGRSGVAKNLCRKCTPLSIVLVNILKKPLLTKFFSNDMIQLCTSLQQKSAGVSFSRLWDHISLSQGASFCTKCNHSE